MNSNPKNQEVIDEFRRRRNRQTTLTIPTVVFLFLMIQISCDRRDTSSNVSQSVVNQNNASQKEASSEVASLSEAIEYVGKKNNYVVNNIYIPIETELTGLEERLNKSRWADLFGNSARITRETLREYINALKGYGLIMIQSVIDRSEIKYPTSTTQLYDYLGKGMRGFGHLESGKMMLSEQKLMLLPKTIFEDRIPEEAHLITGGSFRGFFLMKGGDLVVPGLAFYNGVLEGRIDVDKYPILSSCYKDDYSKALGLLESTGVQEAQLTEQAAILIESIVENPEFIPKDQLPEMHYNCGYAYSLCRRSSKALMHLDKATTLDPHFGPAYLQKGIIYWASRYDRDSARKEFLKAVSLENDTERLKKIQDVIKKFEER